MSRLFLVFLATCLLAADESTVPDLKEYILFGASLVEHRGYFPGSKTKDARPKWAAPNGQGVSRSKGRYTFGDIKVGELVRRTQNNIVIDEWIDFDLEIPRESNAPQPPASKLQAGSANSPGPMLPENGKGAILVKHLVDRLGKAKSVQSSPGDKTTIGHTIVTWKAPGASKQDLMWRLQLFYSTDNQFLVGKAPFYARLQISLPLNPEELVFSRNLFAMKPEELFERFSLAGISIETTKPTILPNKMFGAPVSLKVNTKLGRLQSLELNFLGDIEARGIVMKRTQNEFANKAYEAITSKIRSYPAEIRKYDRRTISTTQTIYDQVAGAYYTYVDDYQVSSEDYRLVWSPRGAPNYRLVGNTLQILPPGLEITKELDPATARLASSKDYSTDVELPDFNLPALDFSSLKSNLKTDGRGGFWLDIPMENQGDLPFCFPASMARILRYYGRQVNQFAVATAGGVDMRGTNWPKMVKMIEKCCSKFGMFVRPLKENESLGAFIKESIDNGQPVLWLIHDHARIINGYNVKTGSIYYTDSWGEGFERETMPYQEASKITEFAFVFLPPQAIR